MGLNRARGDMYTDIDGTKNYISGKCSHGCRYCYVNRIYHRFKKEIPPLHLKPLKGLKNGMGKVFLGSSTDMFASEVPMQWISDVLSYAAMFDNQYLLQTKTPHRYLPFGSFFSYYTSKFYLGVTIESSHVNTNLYDNYVLPPTERAWFMSKLPEDIRRFVTIEPIMDWPDTGEFVDMLKWIKPEQINIGADTGHNHLPEPPAEKVRELITELKTFTLVVEKNNLRRLLK